MSQASLSCICTISPLSVLDQIPESTAATAFAWFQLLPANESNIRVMQIIKSAAESSQCNQSIIAFKFPAKTQHGFSRFSEQQSYHVSNAHDPL